MDNKYFLWYKANLNAITKVQTNQKESKKYIKQAIFSVSYVFYKTQLDQWLYKLNLKEFCTVWTDLFIAILRNYQLSKKEIFIMKQWAKLIFLIIFRKRILIEFVMYSLKSPMNLQKVLLSKEIQAINFILFFKVYLWLNKEIANLLLNALKKAIISANLHF